MAHLVYLVDQNPNDVTGGGGDIAGPEKDPDSVGPYFVWPAQEFDSAASPYAVVSLGAVLTMLKLARQHVEQGNVLQAGGERMEIQLPETVIERDLPESEEFDFADPAAFARAFADAGE